MEEVLYKASEELKRIDHLIYVSLKYTNGSGTETQDYSTGYSREGKFDLSEKSLGVGFQSNSNKIELNYNIMDTDLYDLKSYGIDYIKSIDKLSFDAGKFKIKPEFDIGLKYYKEVNDRSGMGIKLGVGLATELSKNFELGIGYEYQYIKWETLDGYYTDIDTSASLFDFMIFGRVKF